MASSPIHSPYPKIANVLLQIEKYSPQAIKAINYIAMGALAYLANSINRTTFWMGIGAGVAFRVAHLGWQKIVPSQGNSTSTHCDAPSAAAGCGPSYSRLYAGMPLPEWVEMTVSNGLFAQHMHEHSGEVYVPFFGFLLGVRLVNAYMAYRHSNAQDESIELLPCEPSCHNDLAG